MTITFYRPLTIPAAVVSLDAFMNTSDMGSQVSPVGIGNIRASKLALEWFEPIVNVHVGLQISFIIASIVAKRAAKCLLSVVRSLMFLQITCS